MIEVALNAVLRCLTGKPYAATAVKLMLSAN
jgi:hypothetical protein